MGTGVGVGSGVGKGVCVTPGVCVLGFMTALSQPHNAAAQAKIRISIVIGFCFTPGPPAATIAKLTLHSPKNASTTGTAAYISVIFYKRLQIPSFDIFYHKKAGTRAFLRHRIWGPQTPAVQPQHSAIGGLPGARRPKPRPFDGEGARVRVGDKQNYAVYACPSFYLFTSAVDFTIRRLYNLYDGCTKGSGARLPAGCRPGEI